ncbi:MAG: hypothetical protein A2X12_06280 [Bacteroidetes bacterium GWE2_29_8]|nr:MAG: hypothetical protein A2X12_06280 [Bacteroidetes bacterium GWE2_29_8]
MIYLNNAATSFPKPMEVNVSVIDYLARPPYNYLRNTNHTEDNSESIVTKCRKNIATLFNIKNYNRIAFTSGATESLNLAIKGISLENAHVITSVAEHNSVIRPLKTLEKEGKIEISYLEADTSGKINLENINNLIKKNTKAIILNHCSNVTGSFFEIKELTLIAKKYNLITILDVSQSAGNIDIDASDIDILCFTGHKSLFGLPGIGGIFVNENIDIKPLKTGGTGTKSDYLFQPEIYPIYLEAGTLNLIGIVSLSAGIEYILRNNLERLKKIKKEYFFHIYKSLKDIPAISIIGETNLANRLPIFAFNISGLSPDDVSYILEHSFNIIVRSGLHCAPLIHKYIGTSPDGCVRASFSHLNTMEEIDNFVKAILQICK